MMDLSNTQSNLSLGFMSHTSSIPNRTLISDSSTSFQIDSRSANANSSLSLQLLERNPRWNDNQTIEERKSDGGDRRDDNEQGEANNDDEDGNEDGVEFRILGHSLCLKRHRDREDSVSSSSVKRVMVESSVESRNGAVKAWGNQSLRMADPEIYDIIEKEKNRQYKGIELIASENFVCKAVMEALGSHLTNKYSEGMPGQRYYGGNQYIDEIEMLCCERALAAFDLNSENWGVNVQPYSCTSANFAVYTGLLLPGDRIMGLDTLSGGNTSHGCYTPNGRKVSGASIFFESLPYKVNPQTGYVDYDKLEEKALDFRPKILICGGSSYPREWDYVRLRQIADNCGAILMCDMAQISGLIAAKVRGCNFYAFVF